MPHYICTTCGTQCQQTDQAPAECVICQDERQYVGWSGQQWSTFEQLRQLYQRGQFGELSLVAGAHLCSECPHFPAAEGSPEILPQWSQQANTSRRLWFTLRGQPDDGQSSHAGTVTTTDFATPTGCKRW